MVYTEAIQTVIMILGSCIITYLGLQAAGGWEHMKATVTAVHPDHFNMWRPMTDPDFPWTGPVDRRHHRGHLVLVHRPVHRAAHAGSPEHNHRKARRDFGAYLKLLPILIFLVPGIIALALTIQDPATYHVDSADRAFPMLVTTLLPTGLKGLVAGGLMAALMSSLASVFNSASTIFTMDIYKKLKPDHTEKQFLTVGKISTGVIVLLGIVWIPIMSRIGGGVMYQYLQNVQSYIAPPVTTVFLLGILWKRVNAPAAITTLLGGTWPAGDETGF